MDERLAAILARHRPERAALIPILQQAQEALGYLPEEAMLEIARFTGVPESQVFGVASFYAQFRFSPMGRKRVMVCRGTACHVRGAPRILDEVKNVLGVEEGGTTPDQEYTLETVACIGCCALSPCMMINKDVYAKLTPAKVRAVFSSEGQDHDA